ncbi:flagellar hook-length control protein FliK [Agarivorans sp. B2Z047]|uniref:flagellar hook-length control protein FliK n=1 Tax=Agarivorans sp. B2Z047 TaxID=2652721 RepID=UPI001883DA5C|nr:flagellar hook-length control protein FliK [Agarivorans sp. B2Z047]UQN41350.1 flagellar hook-length control protein FliK [Agarivorans sp. B2Z047]
MELLLTDTADAKQFSSLGNAALSPSEKSDDFAKLVKELENLPKADSPVKQAIEKQLSGSKNNASDDAEAGKAQSPSDLLKQLDNAKQAADGIDKNQGESKKTAETELVNGSKSYNSKDISIAEESSKDEFVDTEALSKNQQKQSFVDSDLAPKQEKTAVSDEKLAADKQTLVNQPAQSGRELPPTQAEASKAHSSDAKDSSQVSDGKDAAAKPVKVDIAATAGSQNAQTANSKEAAVEGLNSTKSETTDKTTAGQEQSSNKQQLAGETVDPKKVADKDQKLDSSNERITKENAPTLAGEHNKTLSAKEGERLTSSANEKAPLDKVDATVSQSDEKKASKTKESEAAVSSKTEKAPVDKSFNATQEKAFGDKPLNVVQDKTSETPLSLAEQNRSKLQGEAQANHSTAKSHLDQEEAKAKELNAKLSGEAVAAQQTSKVSDEPKAGVVVQQGTNTTVNSKVSAADIAQQSDKLASANIAAASSKHSSSENGSEHKEQQSSQTQQQGLPSQAEATRPQEHHSIFRAASGADVVARAEQGSNEAVLKQAQQVNDKATQFNERLNPAQYQAPAELNQRVQYMLSQGMQKAEIRLDPAELGSMQIRLQMNQDQQVSVQIQVQNPQAREALEQTMPRLREMLQQQGIELGQNQVSQQNQGSASQQGGGQTTAGGQSTNGELVDDTTEQDMSALLANHANSDGIDFYA